MAMTAGGRSPREPRTWTAAELGPDARLALLGATILPALAIAWVAWIGSTDPEEIFVLPHALAFVGAVLAVYLLLVVYEDLLENEGRIGEVGRALWSLAFVLAAPIAMPIYWLSYVASAPTPPRPAG
jgi:hypothetical protein